MEKNVKNMCAWLLVAVACSLCVSCIKNTPTEASRVKNVLFIVRTLNVATEPMQTRDNAGNRAPIYDDEGGQELTDLYFFVDGNLVCHQQNSQADFGTIALELEYGEHDVTVVATRSEGQQLRDGVLEANVLRPTFGVSEHITITDVEDAFVLEMMRLTASLLIEINDAIPTGASVMRVQIADKYDDLSVSDFAGVNGYNYSTDIPISSMVSNTGVRVAIAMLCPQYLTSYNTDVDITIYNAGGSVIARHAIPDTPIKSNTITRIFGNFFSPIDFSVMISYDWEDGVDIW